MYIGFNWLFAALICVFSSIGQAVGQVRYKELSFGTIVTQENIHYRTAPDFLSNPDSLFMDLYEPQDDTASVRPAIMVLYGGSFVSGSRKDTLITNFSNYFARCGYVVFAIDYRIGVNSETLLPQAELPKAMYRAIQDSRAAVRFIRKNAETYKIDTTSIFALGYSAGAVTLLHHAYLEPTEAAQNQLLAIASTLLGSLDDGEDLEYSNKIDCVINCCGAIADTSWIKSGDSPILSFHGTNDMIVPYSEGYINNDSNTTILFGSSIIHQKAVTAGIVNKLVTFDGADHYLSGEPRVTIPTTTTNFLYGLMNPTSIKYSVPFAHNRNGSFKTVQNQYFDAAGRLLNNKRVTPATLIVQWNHSDARAIIKMQSELKDR